MTARPRSLRAIPTPHCSSPRGCEVAETCIADRACLARRMIDDLEKAEARAKLSDDHPDTCTCGVRYDVPCEYHEPSRRQAPQRVELIVQAPPPLPALRDVEIAIPRLEGYREPAARPESPEDALARHDEELARLRVVLRRRTTTLLVLATSTALLTLASLLLRACS